MSNQDIEKIQQTNKEEEVNLIDLAKTLINGRKTIIKITAIFMLIGLLIALFSETEYTAYTTMVPQTEDNASGLSGNLGGLAAMAGINLNSLGEDAGVSPNLYPKIIRSIPFQKELMKTPLTIKGQKSKITFSEYYERIYNPSIFGYLKKFTIGLPSTIKRTISANDNTVDSSPNMNKILSINKLEKELIQRLGEQLLLEVNDKDGDIKITAIMPEAEAAAELTLHAQNLLQAEITNYKVQKAIDQLNFVENQYAEKQKEFEAVQQKLALFRDQNRNVSKATARTELQGLEAEYNLIYGVYSELAKQLETQKIQVKRNTPVFTIIEPVTIPFDRSAPNRPLILVLCTFAGIFIGFIYIFSIDFIKKLKSQLSQTT